MSAINYIAAPVVIAERRDRVRRMINASPSHSQPLRADWADRLFKENEKTAPAVVRSFDSVTPGEVYTPAPAVDPSSCVHKFQRVGYLNKMGTPLASRFVTATCENPVRFQCRYCLMGFDGDCGSRVASDCAPCELRYRSKVRAIARIPMMVALPGTAFFITLTAPGSKRHCLTHTYKDKDSGARLPSVRCDWEAFDAGFKSDCHECPCSENNIEHPDDMAVFNSRISRRFNDLITELRRSVPGFERVQYFRAVEPQERGALHIHAIFIVKRAFKIDTETRAAVTAIAMRLGFGHQLDIKKLPSSADEKAKMARYIAKYVSKTDGSARIPYWDEVVTYEEVEGLMRVNPVSRRRPNTWSSSRGWGVSMKRITAQRMIHRMNCKEQAADYLEDGKNGLQALRDFQELSFHKPDYGDPSVMDFALLVK